MFKMMIKNGVVNGQTLWRFDTNEFENMEDLIEHLIDRVLNSNNKISDYRIVEVVNFEGGLISNGEIRREVKKGCR